MRRLGIAWWSSSLSRSISGLDSEFSIFWIAGHTKTKNLSLFYYLPIAGGRTVGFTIFPSLPWISYATTFMQDASKAVWSIPYVSVASFPSLKQNFIVNRSSKVLDCIFEIHQLWQSGFSRVYSNCCCSCSFEPEIIKNSQSSHKMYSNKILNSQVSTPILNPHSKKVWKLIVCTSYFYYLM